MRRITTVWKDIYFISSAAVGVGCFFAFLNFIYNLDDGFISRDNKPAAIWVAVLAWIGASAFLFLGRFIFKSYSYIGPAITVILLAGALSPLILVFWITL